MTTGDESGCVIALEGVVFDGTSARAAAVSQALLAYPGVDASPVDPVTFATLMRDGAFDREEALAVVLLRAAAAGVPYRDALHRDIAVPAAIEPELAARLFTEHYLGARLFEAATGQITRYHHGPGTIDGERLIMPAARLRRLPPRPLAAVSHRPRAEVLFKLLGHGVADAFNAIVAREDAVGAQTGLRAALFGEARRRLMVLGASVTPIAWTGSPVDSRAAEAAGLTPHSVQRPVT